MSMDKMLHSLLSKDQEEFNSSFDAELKSRISEKMPEIANNVSRGILSPDIESSETGDTINNNVDNQTEEDS